METWAWAAPASMAADAADSISARTDDRTIRILTSWDCERGRKEGLEADGSRHLNCRPRHWFRGGFSRLLKKSERAVKNHEQIGIKTGPFMNQSAATLSFSTAC